MIIGLSLEEFKNKISDVARPNRFEVEINPPKIAEFKVEEFREISWLVESASIPTRTQGEIGIKFHGMELKIPGDYAKENLVIGFKNTYDWKCREFFEIWMSYIQRVDTNNTRNSSFDMIDDAHIIINQVGRTNKYLSSYKFYNVFPTNISAIELSMDTNDSYEKFTVNFAFSHFNPLEV